MIKKKEKIDILKKEISELRRFKILHTKKFMNPPRRIIFEIDENKCVLCGETNGLQIHHLKPKFLEKDCKLRYMITVCEYCHYYLHYNPKLRFNHRDLTREGIEMARKRGKVIGRPFGSKDKSRRRKEGYFNRVTNRPIEN